MQKENLLADGVSTDENIIQRATPETENTTSGGSLEISGNSDYKDESQKIKNEQDNCSEFEDLIKGPYKDAFTKKVQSIIDKRFKEQKTAEAKQKSAEQSGKEPQTTQTKSIESSMTESDENSEIYQNLIAAGVDRETAYRVLHLDEIMDSSMRYGAQLAAKHLTDSIKNKSARPTETAVSNHSITTKVGVGSLTPEKRKELAKKALMGEHIGF